MILCSGSSESLRNVMYLVELFSETSGLRWNVGKCMYYSASLPRSAWDRIAALTGFSGSFEGFRYLGVPIFYGKPRQQHFRYILDKIIALYSHWNSLQLSMMGRVQLVKSIISGMVLYSFLAYSWPIALLKELDRVTRNFVWSGSHLESRRITVAWGKACKPTEEGGLGLWFFKTLCKATLYKRTWDCMHSADECFVALRWRWCGGNTSYLRSSIWQDIRVIWSSLRSDTSWILGRGTDINFWNDRWCLDSSISDLLGLPEATRDSLSASVNLFADSREWVIPEVILLKVPGLRKALQDTVLPCPDREDTPVWNLSQNGIISLRGIKEHLYASGPSFSWGKRIWNKFVPPARSCFVWKFLWNRIPTDEVCKQVGVSLASWCPICQCAMESTNHVFFECGQVKPVWVWFSNIFNVNFCCSSMQDMLELAFRKWKGIMQQISVACIIHSIWHIWLSRNNCRFRNEIFSLSSLFASLRASISIMNVDNSFCVKTWKDKQILNRLGIDCGIQVRRQPLQVLWYPPLSGYVKVNSDGGALGNPGHAGI
ncbi:hypothetical protein Fmac_028265 [Flemingia macrophylla]|uniref:Reverse transcriptase zinc-binding domain-containing protein n=1 Tax=Flemingia macrophylla TaxID=520843 RepID=A0ABD1L717_9FABA